MKLYFFPLLIVAIVAMACGTKKNAQNGTADKAYSEFIAVAKNDSTFASIHRSYCFGKCPVYTLTIYNNGNAVYEGTNNVEMMGTFSGKFTPAQMDALIASAKSIHFMEMEDTYDDPNITDIPSTTTSIVIDGKRKTVMRRKGYPQEIKMFEETFDTLVKEVKWTLVKASEIER